MTTQAQPNLERSAGPAAGRGLGPGQRLVDVGAFGPGDGEMLGLFGSAYTLLGSAAASPNQTACAPGRRQPTPLPQSLAAEVADAVEQPVAHLPAGRDVEADQ